MSTEQRPIHSFCVVLDYASSFPSRDVRGSEVPSWVPDWRAEKRASLILRTNETCHPIGALNNSVAFEVSDRILRIKGWSYRLVPSRMESPQLPPTTDALSVMRQLDEWWTSYKQVLRDRTKSGTENVDPSLAWHKFAFCAARGTFE